MIYRAPYIIIEPYTGKLSGNQHKIETKEWQEWHIKDLKGVISEIVRHVDGFSGPFKMGIRVESPVEEDEE